jgi:hypothetical protein
MSQNNQSQGELITILGPKSSGKTVYLAGIANYSRTKPLIGNSHPFEVVPLGGEADGINNAKGLKQEGFEIIIVQGDYLDATVMYKTVDEIPKYEFQINIIDFKYQLTSGKSSFLLVVRDYPGEVYKMLKQTTVPKLEEEYIKECFKEDRVGCLILFDQWDNGEDNYYYYDAMSKFIDYINKYRKKPFRIAVAISKCERGELWPGRIVPEKDLFEKYLPKTTGLLKTNTLLKKKAKVKFFAISTFGVLDFKTDPRANRKTEEKEERSVLRERENWQPYGMMGPLYWLSTGKTLPIGL